ncbi:MAG TPA: N-acetylmuramoyl-L-alanine amidase [Anaerolineales bacterium]|nr:N-acetylmuramoyl-L-alanine amidase [Anaerolineales bacterium]
MNKISRRQFLELVGTVGLAALIPPQWLPVQLPAISWPTLPTAALPTGTHTILQSQPRLEVDRNGNFKYTPANAPAAPLPIAQTQWNREHAHDWDRLETGFPWAIVLHWFGDSPGYQQSTEAYLRGFDGLRMVSDYETRTSAHCLVGAAHPANPSQAISILQAQLPHADGTPLVASHLQMLDIESHLQRLQYFVRALYQLEYQEPTIHSILQDWFDGPRMDPNMRSLAIEITGQYFDALATYPPDQQIANTVAVVTALMRRYQIPSSSILGHLEIQTSKPDPGKKFMALIRFLLGAVALTNYDPTLKHLLFAQYLGEHGDPWQAMRTYFQFTRDYLLLTSRPVQVYEWESESSFWPLIDQLPGSSHTHLPTAWSFHPPLPGAQPVIGATFTNPPNHSGADLYLPATSTTALVDVLLSAPGECLFAGPARFQHPGLQVIFRHRQADGSHVLSLYGNLNSLANLQIGMVYPAGQVVGQLIGGPGQTFILHLGIAYGATWETDMSHNPDIPLNASITWISQRFMDPLAYLAAHQP